VGLQARYDDFRFSAGLADAFNLDKRFRAYVQSMDWTY